jgi:tRNA-modifying protein YgfZ
MMRGFFDLSARAKLRMTGKDRVRFLNGQVTNDVRKANANFSMPACVLNAKGKIDALIFVSAGLDDFLIDAAAEQRETLAQRLDRYVIADDVTIEDVTDRFSLFHVTGETAPVVPNDTNWRRAKRFGIAGWDLMVAAEEHDRVRQSLSAIYSLCEEECAERLRIEQGMPRWGRELTDQIIPVEANLAADTVDYAKGCYIGQEVISRMKMSGQMSKRLCGLIALGDTPLSAGMEIFATDPLAEVGDRRKKIGWITSATRSDSLGREIALGYVKRGLNEMGTQLEARSTTEQASSTVVPVKVVGLPFR